MQSRLHALGLSGLSDKLEAGERLTFEDGVRLFACPDLHAVGWLANRERERRHGARTYYNFNLRLEATNVCVASCLFCSFARLRPGDAWALRVRLGQFLSDARPAPKRKLVEFRTPPRDPAELKPREVPKL